MNVNIRWLIRHDLHAVLDIESWCYEQGWTECDFMRVLRKRNTIGVVAEIGSDMDKFIAGFVIYELHGPAIRIVNMSVHPCCQRRQVGTQLIEMLKDKLGKSRRSVVQIVVRESNVPAQIFLAHCGLRVASIKRGHYTDTREDAYEFQYLHLNDYSEEESQWTHARSERSF